jgi:hypothetical protein
MCDGLGRDTVKTRFKTPNYKKSCFLSPFISQPNYTHTYPCDRERTQRGAVHGVPAVSGYRRRPAMVVFSVLLFPDLDADKRKRERESYGGRLRWVFGGTIGGTPSPSRPWPPILLPSPPISASFSPLSPDSTGPSTTARVFDGSKSKFEPLPWLRQRR